MKRVYHFKFSDIGNFFLLILFWFPTFVFAQNRIGQINEYSSDNECRKYFKDNILDLDPIEGIYQVETFFEQHNDFRDFPTLEAGSGYWIVYKDKNGVFRLGFDNKVTIKRIGDSSYYIYNMDWKKSDVPITSSRFSFNGTTFQVKYKIPFSIMAEVDREKASYLQAYWIHNFVKDYPTKAVIQEALLQEAQKQQETRPKAWSGTGFALMDGYLVTNFHVVENAKSISIQGINGDFGKQYNAKIVATDKYNDLALLQITDNTFKGFGNIPYNVKTTVSEVGEDIFVLGYPLTSTMGDEIKLTTGVISSKTGFQGDISLYQISAPIQPGNSGGPLFDNKGNLIGIVNAKHKGAENVGYAIKTSYLKNLIESSISTSILPSNNRIAGLPLTGKVKSLKNYVFMITCSNTGNSSTYSVSPSAAASIKTIEYPAVSRTTAERVKIKSVKLAKDYTAIEITCNSQPGNLYLQWYNIDRNTYILVNGTRYTLTRTDGIQIAPEKTYFSYAGQNVTFTLYFPPIPDAVTSIDLIESVGSSWKFYGIKIR